jgi:hypothetical protein
MPNRLALESSPYLRQHADNPVDWFPWGEEAFRIAGERDRPIHLSVGYAACHWCHVMAHESFEDPQVAQLLNERFVNIKVDRQERPDVDDIYQRAVQLTGQSGGWPLTVFLTPAGEPFFAGTYFPPEDRYGRPAFGKLLLTLSEVWSARRGEVRELAAQYVQGLRAFDVLSADRGTPPDLDLPLQVARLAAERTDPVHGGLAGAPKFPHPSVYDLVLRVAHRNRAPALLKALEITLDRMAAGGIYDHLGGGFARYSVDERWDVPHFEKMLYDNAQLAKLYADAYRLTGKPAWRRVFEDTLAYLAERMTGPAGGLYASEDADSEGEEGRHYLWTPAQIDEALGPADGAFASEALGIGAGGAQRASVMRRSGPPLPAADESRLDALRARLLAARERRPRPARDENVIASWNGLAIQGLCAAYQATGTTLHLAAARRTADFIAAEMTMPDGGVYRAWREGKARVPGFLDDYANLANAHIDLYESGFDAHHLERAIGLAELILDRFWQPGEGLFLTARDGEQLVQRPRTVVDGACPAGTSASVFAFLRLAELTGGTRYRERAQELLQALAPAAARDGLGFAHLLAAREFAQRGPLEIVFAGERREAGPLIAAAHRAYLPARVLAFAQDVPAGESRGPVGGRPAAYVCRYQACQAPVTTAAALAKQLAG